MQFKHLCLTIIIVLNLALPTFAQEPTVLEHGGGIWTVAFSPVDASLVASAAEDGTIKLWNLQANTVATLAAHDDSINSIAFSPDGQLLASGSEDFTVKVWSVPTKQIVATLEHVVDGFAEAVTGVSFSPDGEQLATAGANVKLWDVSTFTEEKTLETTDWLRTTTFSPDGQRLVTGDESGAVKIWSIQSGQSIDTLEVDANSVYSVQFSADNRTLAIAGDDGLKLWALPNWQSSPDSYFIGTLSESYEEEEIGAIAFTPDGRTLASADGERIDLWGKDSGVHIAELENSTWVNAIAFSPDGASLASGGEDGKLRIWDLEPYMALQQIVEQDIVRMIYFLPNDRPRLSNVETKLDKLIRDTQQFFANQMQVHGFGRKTFTFETDENGNALVHQVVGKSADLHYHTDTDTKVVDEISERFDLSKNLYLIVADVSSDKIAGENTCGVGWNPVFEDSDRWKETQRYAIIPAEGDCFDEDSGVPLTAHELGHAFGLEHDFRNNSYIMSYGDSPNKLARCSAEWLDASRFFNTYQIYFNERGAIFEPELYETPPDAIRIRFEVTDDDGLHLAQLIIPATASDPSEGVKLQGCQSLRGQSDTVEFIVPELPAQEVTLQVIDVYGKTMRKTYPIGQDEVLPVIQNPLDVNGDENIDTADLLVVAGSLGQTVTPGATPNPADVNGDNVVDIEDIILVAAAMDAVAAAPASRAHSAAGIATTDLRRWIDAARQRNTGDATVIKAIAVLEQLLAIVHPKETRLMANYPNPFNPETWIPYQLSMDAEVAFTIYDTNGRLIRALGLGHKPAGVYQSRNRAAYWDGRNELGEPVASGVYFYTFTARDFTATRKMVIRK